MVFHGTRLTTARATFTIWFPIDSATWENPCLASMEEGNLLSLSFLSHSPHSSCTVSSVLNSLLVSMEGNYVIVRWQNIREKSKDQRSNRTTVILTRSSAGHCSSLSWTLTDTYLKVPLNPACNKWIIIFRMLIISLYLSLFGRRVPSSFINLRTNPKSSRYNMWRVWIIHFYLDYDMGNLRSNSETHIGRFNISMNISNIVKIIESTDCLKRERRNIMREREREGVSHLLDYSSYCGMTKSLAWSHLTKIRKIDWKNLREGEGEGEGRGDTSRAIKLRFPSAPDAAIFGQCGRPCIRRRILT